HSSSARSAWRRSTEAERCYSRDFCGLYPRTRRLRRRMLTTPFPATVTMTPATADLHRVQDVLSPGQDAPVDLTIYISCYEEETLIIATLDAVREALGTVSGLT